MKIGMGVECGQRWYWLNSWFPRKRHKYRVRETSSGIFPLYVRRFAGFRRFRGGFAVGPIMFWKE